MPNLTPLLSPSPQDNAYRVYRQLREHAPVLELVPQLMTRAYRELALVVSHHDR